LNYSEESERKQTVIEVLRAEIDQLRARLTEANEAYERLAELTSGEEEQKQLSPKQGRDSWGSNGLQIQTQIEEHLKHIRQIMVSFLSRLPFTTKDNEDILPVLFSMMNFTNEQTEQIQTARAQLNSKKGQTTKMKK
jgi:hypothetical protein